MSLCNIIRIKSVPLSQNSQNRVFRPFLYIDVLDLCHQKCLKFYYEGLINSIISRLNRTMAVWWWHILDKHTLARLQFMDCWMRLKSLLKLPSWFYNFFMHVYFYEICGGKHLRNTNTGGFHLYFFPFNFPFIYISN